MSDRGRVRCALLVALATAALATPDLLANTARAARRQSGDTGVVDVTRSPFFSETEPSISVDPLDPDRLIVGSNRWEPLIRGQQSLGADGFVDADQFSSRDGGRTWTGGRLDTNGLGSSPDPLSSTLPILPPEFDDAGNTITADQHSLFDRHGNSYYEVLGMNLSARDIVVPVWRSTDGGRDWGTPSIGFSEARTLIQIDRPWLAIDNTGGARDGTLYLTWETMFYQPYLPEVFERSSADHGRTWGPVVRVDRGTQRTQWDPRQFPAVGAGGTLYDAYDVASFQPPGGPELAPIALELARSTDGGRTFTHYTVDADVHRVSDPDEAEPYFTELISALAADPAHRGRVAVAWPEATGADNSRIVLRFTLDGGRTWSPRVDVADDPRGKPNQHDHVALAFLPDGRLVVGWRDRRCCGGGFDARFEVFARILRLRGSGHASLGRTVTFTSAPQQPVTQHRGVAPDEYLGLAVSPAGVAMDWSQPGAGGLADVFYRRVPLSAWAQTRQRR